MSGWLAALAAVLVACGGSEDPANDARQAPEVETPALEEGGTQKELADAWVEKGGGKPATPVPVGVALEVDNGEGIPLRVRAGGTYYINQIDLRAAVSATSDAGLKTLRTQSDFAGLGWTGVHQEDQEPVLLGSPGAFTRRRYYRDAAWMNVNSFFTVEPVDSRGRLTGLPILLNVGGEDRRRPGLDSFFVRRLRAIQSTLDCASPSDCSNAKKFEEEALVELRNAYDHARINTFSLRPETTALRLRWSLKPFSPYTIPVEQVQAPAYAYGFSMDIKALTPPASNGTYAPGSEITFQLTLKDGEGRRLHPAGSLPTYNEVAAGLNPAGIEYYRAFFDPTTTYYRRKHRERMLMTQIIGPAQKIQPIRSIIQLDDFLDPNVDEQVVATQERDGVYAQFATLPFANILFRGAFFPEENLWDRPNTDTWTYKIPQNAEPGTYLVTVKGRRVYLGEDRPASKTVEIQVGTKKRTEAKLTTGPCNSCHSDGGELATVLHGNDNRAACAGCHAPLSFELEGPIFVRVHFIHSRSNRVDSPPAKCSSCHLEKASIQRASQAACLSCHKSYPASHVAKFGALDSMYVGRAEKTAFDQCNGACHTQHPGSGL
ncbi:cytochrome c family protein [Myxococcus sp. K15C18031901]|uniref:cytochrome c3 family protein n=1 Tax=Myxococcus dinghuensis TaxID=2906761 RepID=UPI0020A825D0|nr:cytochrome c3 family protein [Myxococcus dinghuensis]MCP3100906.1 cytochrome c family protein [Myxococcus dinghuensis]